MSIFSFFVARNRNLTSESDLTHHFGYKTDVFLSRYDVFEKTKNITHLAITTFLNFTSVFWALPVTGKVSNYPQYTHKAFSYHMQKTVWLYVKSVARKVVLRFWLSKKSYLKLICMSEQ